MDSTIRFGGGSGKKKVTNGYGNPSEAKTQVKEAGSNQYSPAQGNQEAKTVVIPKLTALDTTIKPQTPHNQIVDKEFSLNDVHLAMDFYRKVNKRIEVDKIFNANPPKILPDFVLQFELTAEQKAVFASFEADFLDKIRKKLENSKITLKIIEYVPEEIEPTYTNYQRFQYLAKRNPLLDDLVNTLGLEVDH
ncbi:MAG: hypothetical protein MUE85_10640 [Microscillaceae bacterium]|nr:hypothetical protein [Microscillaceae bacterium]